MGIKVGYFVFSTFCILYITYIKEKCRNHYSCSKLYPSMTGVHGDRTTAYKGYTGHTLDSNWIEAPLCMNQRDDFTWSYWSRSSAKVGDYAQRRLKHCLLLVETEPVNRFGNKM